MSTDRQALEALADSPDLLRLESILERFNLFEAVGVVRQELRHSNFLAYLLDPSQSHGLGMAFLTELLQSVRLTTEDEDRQRLPDVSSLDLSRAYVLREWHHIDILVLDHANRLAVIIENKIGTGEHSDQLNRYYGTISSHYPGYQAIPLYLTPDGEKPTSGDYLPISYSLICESIEEMAQNKRGYLDSEVVLVLQHYAQIIKRHIVSDSDVAELCRSIYQKHRQALDLIFEHRPDQQAQIGQFVKSLVLNNPSMKFYSEGKSYVNFSLKEWDASLKYRHTADNSALFPYLTFENPRDGLAISLWVGPGDGDHDDRLKVLEMARKKFLTGVSRSLRGATWSRVSTVRMLQARDLEKAQEEIEALISEKWAEYLRDELPRIVQAVRDEKWLWKSPSTE